MYAHSSSRSSQSASPAAHRRLSVTSPAQSHHSSSSIAAGNHHHGVHNPYPPPHLSGHRETPGRRMSAVLAAVASSDLEYSGIMRPPSEAAYDSAHDRSTPGDGGSVSGMPSGAGAGYNHHHSNHQRQQHQHQQSMGDLPPLGHSSSNVLTPSYASGSDRQQSIESNRHARTSASPLRSPWEQGYRDQRNPGGPGPPPPMPPRAPSSSAPADSPVEPPKKRRRKAQATNGSDIPEGAEVEYEDASGDPSRGPVFIHPPKGSVQACVRCHRIKRKCDGLWPRCKSCQRSDVACVFELSPATSSYVHKLKGTNTHLTEEVNAAHERIRFLESQLRHSSNLLGNGDVPAKKSSAPAPPDFVGLSSSALSIKEHAALPLMEGTRSLSQQPAAMANVPLSDLLSHEDALKAVSVYLEFNGLAYPCIERQDLPRWVNELYGVAPAACADPAAAEGGGHVDRRGTPSTVVSDGGEGRLERRKFVIYLVLAIGTNADERAGGPPSGPSLALYQAAMHYRAKALEHEDILCVQALIVLALWTMSNPSTGSMWQVIGLCARVITSIGLHRRADPATPPHVAEQRRRVFYSWYNIERVLAPTLCKPLAIAESDIDIETPTPRDNDVIHRGMNITMVLQHVIGYRRLMGKVLTQLYSVNSKDNRLPEPERRAIIRDLHSEIDDWIVGAPVADSKFMQAVMASGNMPRVNHRNWWQILYHQLLASLYRPSPLCPTTTSDTLRALYDASSRCVDLYVDMCSVNKTSFHLLQIIALFVSCISLLCCLCECDARMRGVGHEPQESSSLNELGLGRYSGPDDPAWATEIRTRVAQCHNLFDVFGHKLPASARYRDTFFRLSELLLARYGPLDLGKSAPAEGSERDLEHDNEHEHEHENEHEHDQEQDHDNDHDHEDHALVPGHGMDGLTTNASNHQLMHDVHVAPIDPSLQLLNDPAASAPNVAGLLQPQQAGQLPPGVPPAGIPQADSDMAGAWDAMTQLWFELGDLFGEESDPFAQFEDSWIGWGGNVANQPGTGGPGLPGWNEV